MEFAAIPTMYKGVQMRSRLEARWAAVFDALGATWEYEPFDLNGWIPDFLVQGLPIPLQGAETALKPALVEIKPIRLSDEEYDMNIPVALRRDQRDKVRMYRRSIEIQIENGMGAPHRFEEIGYSQRPVLSQNWEEFFRLLPYRPVLLGADSKSAWLLVPGWCWWDVSYFSSLSVSDVIWKAAGNAVQWKATK